MIEGIILDKNNLPLNSVVVELKNESFQTLLSTKSDSNGYFVFKENSGTYAYLTAVKEYAIEYLEYWCRNINLANDAHFDIVIDKLEIYNLMAFDDEGSITIDFRPMSLIKYLNQESNICPIITKIEVYIDGVEAHIISQSKDIEKYDDYEFDNIKLKVINSDKRGWEKIDVKIFDVDGYIGMASLLK